MWRRFLVIVLATAAAGLLSLQLIILAVDPLGIAPIRLWKDDVLLESSRRFMAPRVIRSGHYDSYIVGTSTLHHVAPEILEEVLGGRFANIATHGAMPYEQRRMLDLILRQPTPPRSIVHGIDQTWCQPNMPKYHPQAPLPEWLYSDSLIDHLAHSLNQRMLTLVVKRITVALGQREAPLAPSGYHNDLKDDGLWSRETVLSMLWGGIDRGTHRPDPLTPIPAVKGQFAEIDALGDILDRPSAAGVILVLMPVHEAFLPAAGSERAARLSACKSRLRDIALERGVPLIDYLRPTALSQSEENFWDHDHTRVRFASRLAADLVAARQANEDPGGIWIKLAGFRNDAGQP